jgi:predicted SAM-dependent methyltransferase
MMKVLDVGCGDKTECRTIFPDADITTLDINPDVKPDIIADIIQPLKTKRKFDTVFMSHVIEHIPRLSVVPVLRNVAQVLNKQGKMYVITPSLEWAARQIVTDEDLHVSVLASIFGSQDDQWQFHQCGFTIMLLRQAVRMAGMQDMEAYQSSYTINMESGPIKAQQNIVVGWKVSEDEKTES